LFLHENLKWKFYNFKKMLKILLDILYFCIYEVTVVPVE
jgi:hypothetical protein